MFSIKTKAKGVDNQDNSTNINQSSKEENMKGNILEDREIQKLSKIFASKDETYVASLGNGYIMNYLAMGNVRRGFAVISNKRVYFRGKCLSGQGKRLVSTDEERTVDVKDVTGSGFIYNRYLGILLGLVLAILVTAASSIIGYIGIYDNIVNTKSAGYAVGAYDDESIIERAIESAREREDAKKTKAKVAMSLLTAVALPIVIVLFINLLKYFKKRRTLFQIQYAGGIIAFNVSFYAKVEIDDFQKQLRRVKDLHEQSIQNSTKDIIEAVQQNSISSTQSATSDELRKYADLLKEGLITQEEYDALKKKVLGL